MLTFIRYIELNFTSALVDCVCCNEDFVKSRFCSIHFSIILAGLMKIVRYTEDFGIFCVFTHMAIIYANVLEQKKAFT